MLFFCEFLWLADFFLYRGMKQYLIHAFDAKDKNALKRRMAVREKHFDLVGTLKRQGSFIYGGAILNEAGNMIGSNMVLQFETDLDFENYLASEPYVVNKIWRKIKVYPFKLAIVEP